VRVVDFCEVYFWFVRRGMKDVVKLEMILAVLIAEFKL